MCEPEQTLIEIGHTMTVRQAKEHIHRQYLLMQKKLDLRILEEQRVNLRTITKRSTFVTKCLSGHERQTTVWEELDLDLEDEDKELATLNTQDFEAHINTLYKKIVDKAAANQDAKRQKEKAKADSKKQLVNELVSKSPEEFVELTVQRKVREELQKQSGKKGTYTRLQLLEAKAGVEADPVTLMTSSIHNFGVTETIAENALKPKNDHAPPPGAKTGGKGSGKGKSQDPSGAKGKGKGKGKTQGKAKGKVNAGKGKDNKGKGKTSTTTTWRPTWGPTAPAQDGKGGAKGSKSGPGGKSKGKSKGRPKGRSKGSSGGW